VVEAWLKEMHMRKETMAVTTINNNTGEKPQPRLILLISSLLGELAKVPG
jgi:hypothetical protein